MGSKLKQYNASRELCVDQIYMMFSISEKAKDDVNLHSRFKVSYSEVEKIYDSFEKYHSSIIATLATSTEEFDMKPQKEIRADFLDKYLNIKAAYFDLFEKDKLPKFQQPSSPMGSAGSGSCHAMHSIEPSFNIPKMNIPIFDGNYLNWPQFIDMFNSMIHNKTIYSGSDKFRFLVSVLSKEPLSVVKGVPLLEANYPIAYQALVDQYNNPRLLATSYWSEIINSPKVIGENATSLRALLNAFEENIAALKALGLPTDQWSFPLFTILSSKLDRALIKPFEIQDASKSIPSYTKLKEFLQKQCTALESVALTTMKGCNSGSSSDTGFNQNKTNFNNKINSKRHSFLAKNESGQENSNSKPQRAISCPLCSSTSHLIYRCDNFLAKSPEERLTLVKQRRWCLNCLHTSHNLKGCGSKSACRICSSKNHHSLLHQNSSNFVSNNNFNSNTQPSATNANFNSSPQFSNSSSNSSFNPQVGDPNASYSFISQMRSSQPISNPTFENFGYSNSKNLMQNSMSQFAHPQVHYNSAVRNSGNPSVSQPIQDSKCAQSVAQLPNIQSTSSNSSKSGFGAENTHCYHSQVNSSNSSSTTVLLGTAVIDICDAWGNFQKIRVLLDSCSQINAITARCVKRLGLQGFSSSNTVFGLGHSSTKSLGSVQCTIKPTDQCQLSFTFDAEVTETICPKMPAVPISVSNWFSIRNLSLADPKFNSPGSIDALLGADLFGHFIREGRIEGHSGLPSAYNTIFGWVLLGKTACELAVPTSYSFLISFEESIDSTLRKFWELEKVPESNSFSSEDAKCEDLFVKTVSRDQTGRYTVQLPFREQEPTFHNSRSIALRRFLSMEKRLLRDASAYESYKEVINDYLTSGHMIQTNTPDADSGHFYYIPHHYVLKPESTTTKMRVVFDASASDSLGCSLNKTLLPGPKLQKEIFDVLSNFRAKPFVFTADVKQMYRQILITPQQREFQRILWRFSPESPIQDFALQTVSFGISSSAYLAQRTLVQLARDEECNHPLGSKILLSDVYVDDIVSSFSSLNEALASQQDLISLLKKGGFELRKWVSNHPRLLANIPAEERLEQSLSFNPESPTSSVKILGLKWNAFSDSFSYSVDISSESCSKRVILSNVARIFDPLGFLAPLTFFAKHIIQHLWTLGLEWDQIPPENVCAKWNQYKAELPVLSSIQIPRGLFRGRVISYQMLGFADSSERGYAAVVYLRIVTSKDVQISLVAGKSKVAPVQRVSLPRLELCAAHLLSKLMHHILVTYSDKINIEETYAFSDSTVALAWIRKSPHILKTFISNRVAEIQENIPPSCWYHVRSEHNPADCASRGLCPQELVDHPLWWAGPTWLKDPPESWPICNEIALDNPIVIGEEKTISLVTFSPFSVIDYYLERYSSLSRIQRIVAYSLRFIKNLRLKEELRMLEPFNQFELHEALLLLVKQIQHKVFSQDINNLEKKRPLSKPLRKLSPFLDDQGVLRVGGRLAHSNLAYDHKHPAVLPRQHRLTDLIIEEAHRKNFHAGPQTLQYLISQNFWILSARRAIRQRLGKCLKCFRLHPTTLQPPMGNFPSYRVNQIKPFSIVGVDYGGPLCVALSRSRGCKTQKAYLCLFVCAATKAIHLELASDLTMEACLAALRRFVARRGRCSMLFSDQGTNFIATAKELDKMFEMSCHAEKVKWSFNPPSSPHFGGLFEAGIKAAKSFLVKIIGEQVLSFEELYTVLCQVESILNSRPLYPLSNDPHDLSVLTPGHFLTLEPLTCLPDPDLTHLALNRLSRWQLLQRLQQDFWKRWHLSYLNTLQQRQKWNNGIPELEIDSVVLVKNDQLPPLKWRMGRVVRLHPGSDGIARVATIRTTHGLLQRPLVKLCALPNA